MKIENTMMVIGYLKLKKRRILPARPNSGYYYYYTQPRRKSFDTRHSILLLIVAANSMEVQNVQNVKEAKSMYEDLANISPANVRRSRSLCMTEIQSNSIFTSLVYFDMVFITNPPHMFKPKLYTSPIVTFTNLLATLHLKLYPLHCPCTFR